MPIMVNWPLEKAKMRGIAGSRKTEIGDLSSDGRSGNALAKDGGHGI